MENPLYKLGMSLYYLNNNTLYLQLYTLFLRMLKGLHILAGVALFFYLIPVKAQDPMFSQFYANPLYLSPSYAGASPKGSRLALNYRNQWPAIQQTYQTYNVSFDHYFDKINSGVGLFFLSDVAGSASLYTNGIGFQYAFDFPINHQWHVRPGLSFTYLYTGIDYNKLVFYSEVADPGTDYRGVLPIERQEDFDAGVSILTYNELHWVGLTAGHLMRPNIYFYGNHIGKEEFNYWQSLKFSFFGGTKIRLRGNLLKYYKESLTLAYLFEHQHVYNQLNLGAYYHKNPLVFGLWYRGIPIGRQYKGGRSESLVFLAGYKVSDLINIGYSYDFTISALNISSGGAHEISLIWDFHIRERKKKPSALPCPDF